MFDRSAITQGRLIQEFGLCDIKGVYQNTSKLRAKGWLAILFIDADNTFSASAAQALQKWPESLPADKVSILGVARGEKESLKGFASEHNLTYPIVWDFDDYVGGLYGINSTPTLLVTDSLGKVLAKIVGDDATAIDAAKATIAQAVQAAQEVAERAAKAAAAAQQ